MTSYRTVGKIGALSLGAVVALSSCGGGASNGSSQSGGNPSASHSSGSTDAIQVRHTSLGDVLVDSSGMTVYLLTSDRPSKSNCSTDCLNYWPPVAAPKPGTKLPGVVATVGRTHSAAGSSMATVGGWPLYTYVGDKAPGDVTGEGVHSYGGTWYAVSPSGQPVKPGASGSSGGGGGY
jgi:predicted lipoprotein with Yx(FWY)xxD motif